MTSFSVMTWNVENLFRAGTKYGPKTESEYQNKLSRLSDAILRLDPDVLALQEIGSVQACSDLIARLGGLYPHVRLSARPDGRGIRVGFLSKLPIEQSEDITVFPAEGLTSVPGIDDMGAVTTITRLSRGALRIRVRPRPDLPVDCITAHFKSKLLTYPQRPKVSSFSPLNERERARVAGFALLKRTAEAVALRIHCTMLIEGNTDTSLIVLGDLNDGPDAATTQILYGPGGSEIGTTGFNQADKGDDTRLFNLAPAIDATRQYSRIYRGRKELIDHILVSENLLPGKPRTVPIVDSHIDIGDQLPSVTDNPNEEPKHRGSDHAPITAHFELP